MTSCRAALKQPRLLLLLRLAVPHKVVLPEDSLHAIGRHILAEVRALELIF